MPLPHRQGINVDGRRLSIRLSVLYMIPSREWQSLLSKLKSGRMEAR